MDLFVAGWDMLAHRFCTQSNLAQALRQAFLVVVDA